MAAVSPTRPNEDERNGDNAATIDEAPAATASKETESSVEQTTVHHADEYAGTVDYDPDATALQQRQRIQEMRVVQVPGVGACLHEVVFPGSLDYEALVVDDSRKAAKEYPFVLDPFQKQSILCIDNNRSVLVSAHTSAGKTVVAEYAIATSLRANQRVIYTTPIKALSNQKYREMSAQWGDKVGLMTGDVTINPTASCLIMTTEILRSMLYRGSEVMREVGWVIFDEIHYMRDASRGVVWEETIILLPDNVRYAFLSATIPNALQFARWIAWLHQQPCHVVYTDFRPVPLEHFIHPQGSQGLYKVVDKSGNFSELNFNNAVSVLNQEDDEFSGPPRKRQRGGRPGGQQKDPAVAMQDIIVKLIQSEFDPMIVFCFSRRQCESLATKLRELDFIKQASDKQAIRHIFQSAIDVLSSEEDRRLPQIEMMLPMLQRGIAIHHSGLLPIIKEVVELLFQENLVKVLFATETFAMGLNMPAKTVLFSTVRKFDGVDNRCITSGEYIQMSGRAGRRGKDDMGLCILMVEEKMSPEAAKTLLQGKADPLNSAFKLSYNTVLNLLRVEGINPEYMLERSFMQFQIWDSIPELKKKLLELKRERDTLPIPDEQLAKRYFNMAAELEKQQNLLRAKIQQPHILQRWLVLGRLVKVRVQRAGDITNQTLDFGWGMVVAFRRPPAAARKAPADDASKSSKSSPAAAPSPRVEPFVDVLVSVDQRGLDRAIRQRDTVLLRPADICTVGAVAAVVPFAPGDISQISTVALNNLNEDSLKDADGRKRLMLAVSEVQRRYQEKQRMVPLADPIEDMKLDSAMLRPLVEKTVRLETALSRNAMHNRADLRDIRRQWQRKEALANEMRAVKKKLDDIQQLSLLDELKNRVKALVELEYVSRNLVVDLKGRVACELSCGDELLLTEMLFAGVFGELDAASCAALLSCFVCESGNRTSNADPTSRLSEQLGGALKRMQTLARKIASVCRTYGVLDDEEEYVESFKPFLMDVVHQWASGATFKKVLEKTDMFEGSIIRAMRLLEELLRQMSQAAGVMGNEQLAAKFDESIQKIKRDIAFCASLYL